METNQPDLIGPGHRVGPYTIEAELGSGGSGSVYRAHSEASGVVALKVLHEHLAKKPMARARLVREVRLASQLQSSSIVSMIEADTAAARPWMAMPYLEGPTLEESMPLDRETAERVGTALLDALTDLHRAGVVHRDLKPSNVILAADGPVLIDLGVAAEDASTHLTMTGQVLGTMAFMSPEQIRGERATAKSDVWSWGTLMAVACTAGAAPFGDDSAHGTMRRVLDEPPQLGDVPTWLQPFCASCLEKQPEHRPTVTELRHAFPNRPDALALPALDTGGATLGEEETFGLEIDNLAEAGAAPVALGGGEQSDSVDVNVASLAGPGSSADVAASSGSGRGKWLVAVLGLLLVLGGTALAVSLRGGDPETIASDDEESDTDGEASDGDEIAAPAGARTAVAADAERGCDPDEAGPTTAAQRVARLIPFQPRGITIVDSTTPVSCRMTAVYLGHTGTGRDLDQLDDGRVVSAGFEGVRVWDPALPEEARSFTLHEGRITSVEVLNGELVISADNEGIIHVWSPDELSEPVQTLDVGVGASAIDVVDDSNLLVVGTAESEVVGFDTETWDEVARRSDQPGDIRAVSHFPDGRIVTGSASNTVAIWEPDLTFVVTVQAPAPLIDVAVFDDTRFALSLDLVEEILIGDVDELIPNGYDWIELRGHREPAWSLEGMGDGRLLSGGRDRTVRIWDVDAVLEGRAEPETFFGNLGIATSVYPLADGRIASYGGDTEVRIFDPEFEEGTSLDGFHEAGVSGVLPLADDALLSAGEDGAVGVWGAERAMPNHLEPDVGPEEVIAMIRHSSGVLLTGGGEGNLRMWTLDDNNIPVDPSNGPVTNVDGMFLVYELDDGRVLTSGNEGAMHLWDIDGTTRLEDLVPVRLPDHHGSERVLDAVHLPDGRVVSVAESAMVWDPDDPEAPAEAFGDLAGGTRAVDLMPDGRVVLAGTDELASILNSDGSLSVLLEGHRTTLNDVLALDDGRVVSTSFDGTLRVWDVSDPDNPTHQASDFGLAGRLSELDADVVAMTLGGGWVEIAIDP